MEVEKLIRKYLHGGRLMVLSTVNGGKPWCATLYFVGDENAVLYWISLPDRRHSRELVQHSKVAAAMPIQFEPGEDVVGLQVEGEAFEVTSPSEIANGASLYAAKFSTGPQWLEDYIAGKNPHKLYKLVPSSFVLFDEVSFPENARREWNLHN